MGYTGFPLTPLLDRWFGTSWSVPDAEVLFVARDGYRSAVGSDALRTRRAFLAYARSDGAPFTVDNAEQNQRGVPLGPYYVIWDNREAPDRLARGTHGWPYQVTAVEVRSARDDRALLPQGAAGDVVQGFANARKYCLNCHAVRGVGGHKFPLDLARAACRFDDAALGDWIREPSAIRPGTTMPALNRGLMPDERERALRGIVAYLRAIQREDRSCSDPPDR